MVGFYCDKNKHKSVGFARIQSKEKGLDQHGAVCHCRAPGEGKGGRD